MFPGELEVTITSKHLADGSRLNPNESPLALAFCDRLRELGVELEGVRASEYNLYVYTGPVSRGHDARYFISDEAWKLVTRHAEGRRVKPKTVILELIYARKEQR